MKFLLLFTKSFLNTLAIGVAGGIISLYFHRRDGRITFIHSLLILFSGIVSATYLGGAVVQIFDLTGSSADAVQFVTALTAMRIFEVIIVLVEYAKKNPIKTLRSFITGKLPDEKSDEKSDETGSDK